MGKGTKSGSDSQLLRNMHEQETVPCVDYAALQDCPLETTASSLGGDKDKAYYWDQFVSMGLALQHLYESDSI
jgi:hypothetical protein